MLVMKYEYKCIDNMEWVKSYKKLYSVETEKCSYLAVTDDGNLNLQNC